MVLFILFFILLVMIPCIIHNFIYKRYIDDRIQVTAYDGNVYQVRNTIHKQETADTLARLNSKVILFIEKLKSQQHIPTSFTPVVKRIYTRYNPKSLVESRIQHNLTSFTINKGESISMCVRTRDSHDQLYNDNILFGVLLHELAHVGSIGLDHGPEFVKNFEFLLKKAISFGMFQRIRKSFNYCGINTTF